MQVWKCAARAWLAGNTGRKNDTKIAIWAPSYNFIGLSLRNESCIDNRKQIVKQHLLHMSPQYGELRLTSGWDLLACLGHPSKFKRVSRLGSVTALHSSSGRQPNFAALNRGRQPRHLYSAGRSSRWALAYILASHVFTAHAQKLLF